MYADRLVECIGRQQHRQLRLPLGCACVDCPTRRIAGTATRRCRARPGVDENYGTILCCLGLGDGPARCIRRIGSRCHHATQRCRQDLAQFHLKLPPRKWPRDQSRERSPIPLLIAVQPNIGHNAAGVIAVNPNRSVGCLGCKERC